MEFLLSSQPVPQPPPPPPPFPSVSNADDVDFIINIFLTIFANPLFLFSVLLMIYGLRKCFIRWSDARRINREPDIETGATNLDHPSPPYEFSPTLADDDIMERSYVVEQKLKEVIPSFVYDEEGGVRGKKECVICLEDIKDGEIVRVLPECTHIFHKACIDLWFRKKMVCPICRARCSRSFTHVIINRS